MSFNILSTKKVSDRQYNFTVSFNNQTYQFNASVNPDTGKWLLPTADISSVNPIYQNAVRTACSQLGQYLAKNPERSIDERHRGDPRKSRFCDGRM